MDVIRAALLVCCLVVFGFLASNIQAMPTGVMPASSSTSRSPYTAKIEPMASPSQSAAISGSPSTFYGPPFRDNYAYHNDGYSSSVSAALAKWWAQYQIDWAYAFPGCSYVAGYPANGAQTGVFATFNLQGTCGGGGSIYGTAYPYKPGKNTGKPCNCVGDPINFATGNEYRDDTDIALAELSFHRYYNSHAAVVSANVGAHWRHSFDRSLEYLHDPINASVTLYRSDGRQVAFTLQSGAWVADPDIADTLSSINDASNNIVGWTYTNAMTREQESYDAQGHLLSIADVNKQLTVFTYSDASTPPATAPTAGLLLTVTNPTGRQLAFTYNSQGNIATVTQPDGGVTSYSYDTGGNLTQVTYPDTKYRQYVYNESALTSNTNLPNALTGEVDENGVRLTDIGYDSQGRAVLSRMAGSVDVTQVSYGSNGTNVVTYPTGVQATYGFATPNGSMRANSASGPCGPSCGQSNASLTFDANGYPATAIDFNGHVTQSTYNAQGLLANQVEASGDSAQRTTTTTWDTANRVPLTRSVADAGGAIQVRTAWIYNSRAQVTARCDIDPSTSYTCAVAGTPPTGVRRYTYTYCDAVDSIQCPIVGLLLSVDGPRSDVADVTHYSYYLSTDESGCSTLGGACHRSGDLYQVKDAQGHLITYLSYDKNGRVTRQRDVSGAITDFTYHPRGWLLTRVVRAAGSGVPSASDATTTVAYDPTGTVHSITDPDGVTTTYTYDSAHRLTDVTDPSANRTHFVLDAAGNKVQEQIFDAGGNLKRSLSRSYNTLGQLTAVVDGLSHTTFNASFSDSYDADGNLVHSADALGVQRKQGYDALNRLQSTIDNYNGVDPATQNTQSVFAYDTNDHLTGVGDPDGLPTTYGYDGLGNQTSLVSPDTGATTSVYDAAGNRIQQTDAKGIIRTYTYDALNRLLAVSYPDTTLNVSYQYDEADSITGCMGAHSTDRLTRVLEQGGGTTFCYDTFGNVVTKTQKFGSGTSDVTQYTWSPGGRLRAILWPSGTYSVYTLDRNGRNYRITTTPPGGAAAVVVNNVVYQPFGPVRSYTLGNGQTITRTYDANYALTDVVSPALNLHFARDAMGNPIALGNAPGANPAIETYSYDPLYRLTGLKDARGNAVESYTYSKTGDRLSKAASGLATGTYGYQGGTHWLTSIGSSARTYDANGNTTGSAVGGDTFGYGYNGRNRMTVVQRNNQTVATYNYNAFGQRVAKSSSFPQAINQRFAYDEASQLIGEYGTNNRDYIWLDNLPVAVVDTVGTASTVSYVHADGLNTPRVVADATGAPIWQWSYQGNPFGEQQPTSSNGYVFNPRLPGQYFDVESGLAYNVNRDYEAATGRYVQSDPVGLDGGPSTYLYVGGAPLSSIDPLGLIGPQETSIQNKIEVAIARGDTETLETLLEVANPEQRAIIQRALTPARDLISGGLKRSPSYASELEGESYAEICKMSRLGGELGKKAKQMKKLIEQMERLKGKGY